MTYPVSDLARIFPRMNDEEYAALRDDIAAQGLLEPIAVWRDEIVDGQHRARACEETGVEPRYTLLDDDMDAVAYVVARNLKRRHLNETQRDIVADQLSQWSEAGGDRQSEKHWPNLANALSQSEAAKLLNVSRSGVKQARRVREEGAPEVYEAAGEGKVAVSDAAAIVKEEPEVQREALRRVQDGEAKTLRKAAKAVVREQAREEAMAADLPDLPDVQLHHSEVADLHQHVAAESIDWIFTDPPYPREYLPCFGDLADFAAHALKTGGVMLVMSGQSWLPQVMELLTVNPAITYHWTMAYWTPGAATQIWGRRMSCNWKPVIVLAKGDPDITMTSDSVTAEKLAAQDVRYHDWGQNERGIHALMKPFVRAGDTVCDPFVGGGTMAVVARELGCRFVGADADEASLKITRSRMEGNN